MSAGLCAFVALFVPRLRCGRGFVFGSNGFQFGSIMEIGEATVDEISKLEGFGKVLAQRILDVLNNEDKMVM